MTKKLIELGEKIQHKAPALGREMMKELVLQMLLMDKDPTLNLAATVFAFDYKCCGRYD